MGRRLASWTPYAALPLMVLAACGGSGDDLGDGGAVSLPTVDVAVEGETDSVPALHIYRDVLRLPSTGAVPDVRVYTSASVEFMAFTGTHLLVARDMPGQLADRFFIYTPADLASGSSLPSVTVLLPAPSVPGGSTLRAFVVWRDDVYVHVEFDDGLVPTHITVVTYVFRGLTTLTSGATSDAKLTHDQFTIANATEEHSSLAVDDDVLLATSNASVYLSRDPALLVGSVVPGLALSLVSLGVSGNERVTLGGGEAYFHADTHIAGFEDPAELVAASRPRFRLDVPSDVMPGAHAVVRLGGRLFSRGNVQFAPIPVVGFHIGGPVIDYSPPDVLLEPLSTEIWILDGAADTLVSGSVQTGVVHVYGDASFLADGDEPSVYLFDPEITGVQSLQAVER